LDLKIGSNTMNTRYILLVLSLLAGCEDRFRYPCQDPKNFEAAECKPPICTATQTCPDDVTKPEKVAK
jgi:hypothetical protein